MIVLLKIMMKQLKMTSEELFVLSSISATACYNLVNQGNECNIAKTLSMLYESVLTIQ